VGYMTSFKPVRDFYPPGHSDWLQMGTWCKSGQSGSRRHVTSLRIKESLSLLGRISEVT
jgi:hypothetical protein